MGGSLHVGGKFPIKEKRKDVKERKTQFHSILKYEIRIAHLSLYFLAREGVYCLHCL